MISTNTHVDSAQKLEIRTDIYTNVNKEGRSFLVLELKERNEAGRSTGGTSLYLSLEQGAQIAEKLRTALKAQGYAQVSDTEVQN